MKTISFLDNLLYIYILWFVRGLLERIFDAYYLIYTHMKTKPNEYILYFYTLLK